MATHVNEFNQLRTDIIPENLLETQGPTTELIWLNAARLFKDREDFDYYLELHYEAREETGWLDIPPGESLSITADGNTFKLTGTGGKNAQTKIKNFAVENALYLVSADQLRAIARANKVTVDIDGRNGRVTREFAQPNFEKFRKFVKHFVEGEE